MMDQTGAANMKDDGVERQCGSMKEEWCGLTIFYHDTPGHEDVTEVRYLDTPVGLVPMNLTHEEFKIVEDVYCEWANNVYEIVLKPSKRELNAKHFNAEERWKFAEADLNEWRQWIVNKAVEIVPESEENNIPTEKIISTPMRYVRTNKSSEDGQLEAKSSLVLPGHTDPELGLYRTDAPTTSHLAVVVCAALALSFGFDIETFDVVTAFLSGMAMTRELYTKAPPEGLPTAEGWSVVKPYALLRILKGGYGLAEAPRLWYLYARQILVEVIGFIELKCARATVVFRTGGRLIAFLTIHVDDGMMFGRREDPMYVILKRKVDKHFKIEEWKMRTIGKEVTCVGMHAVAADRRRREK